MYVVYYCKYTIVTSLVNYKNPSYWLNKLHRSVNVQKQKGVSVDKHFNRNGHAAVLTEQLRQRLSVINFNYSQRMYTWSLVNLFMVACKRFVNQQQF